MTKHVRMHVNSCFPSILPHDLLCLHLGEITQLSADCIIPEIVADLEQETIIKWYGDGVFPLLHTEVENLPVEVEIPRHDVQNIAYPASGFPHQSQEEFVPVPEITGLLGSISCR